MVNRPFRHKLQLVTRHTETPLISGRFRRHGGLNGRRAGSIMRPR